jgi:hypothetical protein
MVEELLSQTEGVAQVVESLLCKHKALNSNPVPPKRKKKKNLPTGGDQFLKAPTLLALLMKFFRRS